MKKICIIGESSSIAKAFMTQIKNNETYNVVTVGSSENSTIRFSFDGENENILFSQMPIDADFYLVCVGLLYPKKILDQNYKERLDSISVNLILPVLICEFVLEKNPLARITLIGSESSTKGSFDTTYFLGKAALRRYVEERRLSSHSQQLLMVAPSVIIDSAMTQERHDLADVVSHSRKLPKARLLYVDEVVDILLFICCDSSSYMTNTVIEVNGGKFARMK